MNAYLIMCEFLDRLMSEDNCLSYLIYKGNKDIHCPDPNEDNYRIKLIYHFDMENKRNYIKDEILDFNDHIDHAKEDIENYINYDSFYFKRDDLLKVKKIMFIIVEKYIFWENGGEDPYKNSRLWPTLDDESYLESLDDLSLSCQEKNIKWIEEKIPGFSWEDFQNSKKLNSFKSLNKS